MLKRLRHKKTMRQLLWITIALITLPFVFWGISAPVRSREGPAYAGTIFGRKVSLERYSRAWQAARNQALLAYGSKFEEVADNLNLDRQAWERLILLAEAKKKRLAVSDQEVIDTIQNFQFLQSKGQFDKRAYDLILAQVFRIGAREFEEDMRDSLFIVKLANSATKDTRLTNKEVVNAYKKENEKAKISYILASPDRLKNIGKVEENRIKDYYKNNSESFRIPEQVNAEYIGFESLDYQKDIQVNDKDIKDYYEQHKDEFDQKKELKDLRETIKLKLEREAARQKALSSAEKIDYILADKTKDFEEVAKENSLQIRETGFFGKNGPIPHIGWLPEIQRSAFKLNIGERSELIKSAMEFANGYYIIKVKDKRASYIPPLEEVRSRIEDILREEDAMDEASKEAARLHRRLLELLESKDMKFEKAITKIGRKAKETEPFTRNGYIQGIGMASELGEAPFDTAPGRPSDIIKTRAGFCIFTVTEITPIDERKFKRERKEFAKKTLEAKKAKALDEWYTALIKRADLKSNIPAETD